MSTTTSPTTTVPVSPTLDRLLEAETDLSTVFRRHYSSHLSMSLVALEALGAPPEVLEAEWAGYERRYATPREDPEALAVVRAEVAREGIDATVRAHAPALVDGPATKLFHAPIRLAYALDARHEAQVAVAINDWERERSIVPGPPPERGDRRLSDVLADLRAADDVAAHHHSIRDLDATIALAGFQRALAAIALDQRMLDEVGDLVLGAHLVVDDFITLHMVTGAHAIRVVHRHLDGDVADRFLARTVQVVVAAYLAEGAPSLPGPERRAEIRTATVPGWDEIAAAAVEDRDPHVVKLTYVCRAEHGRTGDPLYQHVAARVVGLAPTP